MECYSIDYHLLSNMNNIFIQDEEPKCSMTEGRDEHEKPPD